MDISGKTQDAISDLKSTMMEMVEEEARFDTVTSSTSDRFQEEFVKAVKSVILDMVEGGNKA